MNASTLCHLLAQRIPPQQFQLWGLEIHWMSPDFDTPENNAIYADIVANYTELAAAYELAQIPIKREAMYVAEADPIHNAYLSMKERNHPDADLKYKQWQDKIEEIKARF